MPELNCVCQIGDANNEKIKRTTQGDEEDDDDDGMIFIHVYS